MRFEDRRVLLLLIVFFAVVCLFTRLGEGNLPSYDDAYYAQKGKEILASGNWKTMTIAGNPRFDNPPGFMWLEAASFKMFGVNEFAARLPSALGALLGILGTFFLFELLFSSRIGFLAALILNMTTVYLKYARHSMMDTTVTAAVVWCFYFFLLAIRDRPLFYLVAGLIGSYIMFAKSAFGALPVFALLVYVLFTKQFQIFRRLSFWAACLIFVAPYLIWSWVQYDEFGQRFIQAHFVNLILYASKNRGANDYWYDYFVVILKYFPLFLAPMLYGLWLALKARGEEARRQWFALIYFAVFMFFLTMQGTKKTWYFLPAFPACAGLAAVGLDVWLRRVSLERLARGFAVFAALVFLVLNIFPVPLGIERAVDTRRIAPYARAAVAQGFTFVGYNIDYYGINNAMLFYSDQAAKSVDDEKLRAALAAGKVALLLTPEQWKSVREIHAGFSVVRQAEKMMLVTNAPLAQEQVF